MPVFEGNITGSIRSSAKNLPSSIKSFSLVNKSASVISVTVYISSASSAEIAITPLSVLLDVGEAYISNVERKVLTSYYIIVVASGDCDYYFTIE